MQELFLNPFVREFLVHTSGSMGFSEKEINMARSILLHMAMKKKETWKFILQTLAAIISAILTSLGVSSCLVN